MKRIILSITGLFLAGLAISNAQTMYDALDFGKDNYYGSARTMGMGNAVTAVGGDLGSIALNPAGSAVAGYSQFTISQGLTVSSTVSSWAPAYSEYDGEQVFSGAVKGAKSRYTLPNIGFNMRMETGESSGVKSWNFAFLSTMTNNFLDYASARGYNAAGDNPQYTSMAGSLAVGACNNSDGAGNMLDPYCLTWAEPYNTVNGSGFYDRWQYITAYQGGMINYFMNWNQRDQAYHGASEFQSNLEYALDEGGNKIQLTDDDGNPMFYDNGDPIYLMNCTYFVPGRLNQVSKRIRSGSKNDITTNFGFNINDNLYLGVNLNIPIINYRYDELFSESPDNTWGAYDVYPEMIQANGDYVASPAQQFLQSTYEYNYMADIAGINLGLGFIWLPVRNLRIGGAIKTPTAYTVEEKLYMTVDTRYANLSRHGQSPVGEFTYNFRSPWSMNLGVAGTLGNLGMISADWQMTDYSVMKYSSGDEFSPDDPYEVVNTLMNLFCGVSHTLRLGAEIRPLPFLSLRAGYTYTTNPERYYYDNEGYLADASLYERDYNYYQSGQAYLLDKKYYVKAPVTSVSCGVGFVSTGSFFADFAVRSTRSASYYSPYVTYLEATDTAGNGVVDAKGDPYMVISPCTRSVRTLFDAILTLGWRF